MPEKLFIDTSTCNLPGTPTPDPAKPACAQGVSAVKALALAAAQGQKIYTLNKANQAYHASIVAGLGTDADANAEIANALAAGKEVTVHQADINVSGWTGSGYVILDPDTGVGAYKISGGASGGGLFGKFMENSWPLALLSLALSLSSGAALGVSAPFIGFLLALVLAIDSLILFLMTADANWCDQRTLNLYIAPIAVTILGGFVSDVMAVVLFAMSFILDGALNAGWQKRCN